jgi:hypothetical protein
MTPGGCNPFDFPSELIRQQKTAVYTHLKEVGHQEEHPNC